MSFELNAFSKLYIENIAYLNYYIHFGTWNAFLSLDYFSGKSVFQIILILLLECFYSLSFS